MLFMCQRWRYLFQKPMLSPYNGAKKYAKVRVMFVCRNINHFKENMHTTV